MSLLATSVLSTNLFVFAQETTEEATTAEAEQVQEGSTEQVIPELEFKPVENGEEAMKKIYEANNKPTSKKMHGTYIFDFISGEEVNNFTNGEFLLTYNIEPRLSAEVDFNYVAPGAEAPERLFAYVHNGKFLQHKDDKWHMDDFTSLEEVFKALLTKPADQEYFKKFFDLYEAGDFYKLKLKKDIDAQAFYDALNTKFNFEALKEMLKKNTSNGGQDYSKVLDALFSKEKLEETIKNDLEVEMVFEKETGYMTSNFIIANVPFKDLYKDMEGAENAPDSLKILFENASSNFGEEFDFSFLDEVAPAQ